MGLSNSLPNISDAGCVLLVDANRSYGTRTRRDKVLDCHRRYLSDSEAHHDYNSKRLVVLGTAPQAASEYSEYPHLALDGLASGFS